jgi:NAD(P)-dependent dehydrogenase (short-subunit alcohol dehydrogenase family)
MCSDLVLVTGASGYVAGHCILRLLTDGYRVRGTLRSLKRACEVRQWLTEAQGGRDPGDALSFVEAELTVPKGWDAAMEGVRYVLHVASPIPSSMPKHPDDLIVPAREGTLNVMRAASRALVQRASFSNFRFDIACVNIGIFSLVTARVAVGSIAHYVTSRPGRMCGSANDRRYEMLALCPCAPSFGESWGECLSAWPLAGCPIVVQIQRCLGRSMESGIRRS